MEFIYIFISVRVHKNIYYIHTYLLKKKRRKQKRFFLIPVHISYDLSKDISTQVNIVYNKYFKDILSTYILNFAYVKKTFTCDHHSFILSLHQNQSNFVHSSMRIACIFQTFCDHTFVKPREITPPNETMCYFFYVKLSI